MSSLLLCAVRFFSEKLAFNSQTAGPLGIWASACPTRALQVEPPRQPHAARVVSMSSGSMAKLKKPSLSQRSKGNEVACSLASYLFHR